MNKPYSQPPEVSGEDTRSALLERAIRSTVPIRRVFVQWPPGHKPRHGPLKSFVSSGDLRALRAYLITVAANSQENSDGWTTELDSLVWARLFDTHVYTGTPQGARTAAWRTLERLEDRGLVQLSRARGSRKISVTLLREDGSGKSYTRPGRHDNDAYLRLPTAFWTKGFDSEVGLPGLAMLLAVAAEQPWSSFPAERMEEWYGWSADTTLRGLKRLRELELVERREKYKVAPLTPVGSTLVYQYRLVRWMRPRAQPRPEGNGA